MNAQLCKTTLALALLGPVAFTASLPAHAQTTIVRAPVVTGLQLSADSGLAPGSQLRFTVQGTPRARANVRINDNNLVVALRETAPGVYRGTHTVRASDRIDANGLLRASVVAGQYSATTNYTFPQSFIVWQNNQAQQQATLPTIESFEARPQGGLEPGSEVRFVLRGAPGGAASISIPGSGRNIALREARPGIYRGAYTVRRQDNPEDIAAAAAQLRVGNQVITANLTEPLLSGSAPRTNMMGSAPMLPLQIYSHDNNATVDSNLTQVRGRTAPFATVRVRVDAVPPMTGQRLGAGQTLVSETVQADAQGNFSFNFNPRSLPIPGTRYEVTISAASGGQTAESRLVLLQRG